MRILNRFTALFLPMVLLFAGCSLFTGESPDPLFKRLDSSQTGVDFVNEVTYDIDFNVISFPYIYNGGGVAVGDINKDGLPDLYFTGNMVSSRLYLNEGDMKFKDITQSSNTGTNGWAHGVSMVDINGDGYLDIYVSISGPETTTAEERKNKLFINNQDQTFTEQSEKFGLADTGYTSHTAFFDYDKDGDLDAFLMNNFPGSFSRDSRMGNREEVNDGTAKSTDALYRNNGDGTFSNVTEEAGITKEGYSLGVAVNDYNRDGWPDIYVSNDIQSDDLLYVNNGDGTFTDKAADYFKHTSYAGMGTDAADFNNDGWTDILQVDMMPPSLEEQQTVTGASNYEHYQELRDLGYMPQYPLNTMQLSNGIDQNGNVKFSEIAQLSGVGYTDWSWSALFGDYDSDGLKDVLVTNGYPKNVNNYDYIIDLNRSIMFGGDNDHAQTKLNKLNELDSIMVANYLFKNGGDLTFSDQSQSWGFEEPSLTYGAAYADLDNDMDLDLVMNNTNHEAFLYENRADTLNKTNHNLFVGLRGDSLNTYGVGAEVMISTGGQKQYGYLSPYRGYQSSMEPRLHFGLGSSTQVDTLKVTWPDDHYQVLTNIASGQQITLHYEDAEQKVSREGYNVGRKYFSNVNPEKLNAGYRHQENEYNDFQKEPLLPNMLSRLGPGMAVSDVNGDGREDFYIGGAAGSAGALYLQQADGTFNLSRENQPWQQDSDFEDIAATFFDANRDGNMDLYVVSGGNEFSPASELLQDRLYLNTGDGQFIQSRDALPNLMASGSSVQPADYDGDGDQDLFVGGRLVPGQYPTPANSFILRNDGGTFTDVTQQVAPSLREFGQVTDAEWIDFDQDGRLDLVITGVWMPVTFLRNTGGTFENVTEQVAGNRTGWWYSLSKADFDGDGDQDLVAGNIGLNSNYKTRKEDPIEVYAGDFDGNRALDAVLTVEKNGESYPLVGMRAMGDQLSRPMRRFQTFGSYSRASLGDIVGQEKLSEALYYKADYFSSAYVENNGDGTFSFTALPNLAQISPVNDIIPTNVNGDQHLDMIIAGNFYNSAPGTARNDAGNGLVLLGDGTGNFEPISPFESGFMAPGNVKDLATINTTNATLILVANNNDSLQVIRLHSHNGVESYSRVLEDK